MPDLVLTFLFLGIPLLAGVAGCVLVWAAYSDLKSRAAEKVDMSLARGRLPVFGALAALPFVFGLELWFLVAGLEEIHGSLQGAAYTAVFWMGAGYAVVAALVLASQAWLARARLRAFISIQFGRVLPVMVVPDTPLVFAMILGILALGRITDLVATPQGISSVAAGQIATVFQVYAFAALGSPLGIGLSLRIRDITTTQGFMRSVTFADVAGLLAIAGLIWGFLQLASV